MMSKRKVYRRVRSSKSITPHTNRELNGFAYIIIPSDLDRDEYLRLVYQTGYVMLITRDREILKDVAVPNHLIDEIKFPSSNEVYGDLVSWSTAADSNQLFIGGIFKKPGQYHPYLENVNVNQYNSDEYRVTRIVDGNIPLYSISVNAESDSSGGVELKAQSIVGSSKITLRTDGILDIVSDNEVSILSEQGFTLSISSEEGQISTFTIDKNLGLSYVDKHNSTISSSQGVTLIDSNVMRLGRSAVSPTIKGDVLTTLLARLLIALQTLTVTTSSSGGTSSTPNNSLEFKNIQEQLLSLIISTKVFVE